MATATIVRTVAHKIPLLRSLPLAPTHEIEMTDAGSKTTDSNNQDYRRKVAL